MQADEFAGVVLVLTGGENELEFVADGEGGEILRTEALMLATAGTLHIHDLVNLGGDECERTLAAGFQQHLVVEGDELAHEGDEFALLQHGLAAGDFYESAGGREALHFGEDFHV